MVAQALGRGVAAGILRQVNRQAEQVSFPIAPCGVRIKAGFLCDGLYGDLSRLALTLPDISGDLGILRDLKGAFWNFLSLCLKFRAKNRNSSQLF
jgi:hypothetical protein